MRTAEGFQISDIPPLNGYVAIVTGGNSGIGYETTLQLARMGARVYIASRSQDRVQEAITKMQQANKTIDVRFLRLDLADLQSIKYTAGEFLSWESRLDILINNAGIMATPYSLTKDGHESQWQINFLGHHALTLSLLPLLQQTAAQTPNNKGRVRIVNVSSDLAFAMAPKEINYADPNLSDLHGSLASLKRYGHCKQATIIASTALNTRLSSSGITTYSLHPGIVAGNLQTSASGLVGGLMRLGMKISATSSALDGARTSLFCATSPHAVKDAGGFFVPFGKSDQRPRERGWTEQAREKKVWDLAAGQLRVAGFEVAF